MLPALPARLSPVQRRFLEAVAAGLEGHTFERLTPDAVAVEADEELTVTVEHPDGPDCGIRAFVRDDLITVFLGDAHEDFSLVPDADVSDEGDFAVRAAEWFVDALRGRIEVTATYRGDELLSARYVRRADDERTVGGAGFRSLAHLRVWQVKRRVRYRPSWT